MHHKTEWIETISCAKARTHHSIVGIGHFFLYDFYYLPPIDEVQLIVHVSIPFDCILSIFFFFPYPIMFLHKIESKHQLRIVWPAQLCINLHNNKFYEFSPWLNSRTATLWNSSFFPSSFSILFIREFLEKLLTLRKQQPTKVNCIPSPLIHYPWT